MQTIMPCRRALQNSSGRHIHIGMRLPSQAIQEELKRIDVAYRRFFKKLGGRPHIKPRHKFKSITFPGHSGWKLKDDRITLTLRKWNPDTCKWAYDRVPYTFFKHREWHGTIRRITLKRDNCGDYWLCITTNFVDTEVFTDNRSERWGRFRYEGRLLDT